jgi:IstB-like ATP binding protein
MTAASAPVLAADLDAGLRRLKLAGIRRLAPELMITAKTQRWSPEEFLRTLLDAEIASRDESNARARMKAAAFPVVKTLQRVRRRRVLDPAGRLRLPRLAGVDPRRGELLRGRPGRHRQVPQHRRARRRGRRGRPPGPLLHRRRPRRDPLPRPGRQLRRPRHRDHPARRPRPDRRGRLRPARRHRRTAPVPVRRRRLRKEIPRHRLPLVDQWGRFLPESTTAVSLLDRLLHHAVVVVTETEGESFRMRQARAKGGAIQTTETRHK